MTTFLAIMGQLNAVFKNKPNGSYLTSLDIWLVVCDIFVFATLIEYSICQVRSILIKIYLRSFQLVLRKRARKIAIASQIFENLRRANSAPDNPEIEQRLSVSKIIWNMLPVGCQPTWGGYEKSGEPIGREFMKFMCDSSLISSKWWKCSESYYQSLRDN